VVQRKRAPILSRHSGSVCAYYIPMTFSDVLRYTNFLHVHYNRPTSYRWMRFNSLFALWSCPFDGKGNSSRQPSVFAMGHSILPRGSKVRYKNPGLIGQKLTEKPSHSALLTAAFDISLAKSLVDRKATQSACPTNKAQYSSLHLCRQPFAFLDPT
jgi:hypothetical protein